MPDAEGIVGPISFTLHIVVSIVGNPPPFVRHLGHLEGVQQPDPLGTYYPGLLTTYECLG